MKDANGAIDDTTGAAIPSATAADDLLLSGRAGGVTRLDYGRHLRVLLVEDDDVQREHFLRAASHSVLDVVVDVVDGVDAAIERLGRTGGRARRTRPDIVICDLDDAENLRLLTERAAAETAIDVPVVVMSTSPGPDTERRAFALGAAAHFTTPSGESERLALVHALPDYVPRARAAHAQLEAHQR